MVDRVVGGIGVAGHGLGVGGVQDRVDRQERVRGRAVGPDIIP